MTSETRSPASPKTAVSAETLAKMGAALAGLLAGAANQAAITAALVQQTTAIVQELGRPKRAVRQDGRVVGLE